ncbi:sulfotransferase-like domain-containing protein [Phaeodactylibacter luteus]|uniref:Sulfotransferase family protein n=1 Tax=Phaeodactylibacter luteus TaxID=1564516 RepID=A0A5C6RZN2_9BACT|nr:hypothetical protein [Phaeodactylibacter luteus]TXB67574.1 hypothetical protein FRY97_04055 [Phaeodactylibacter luteus]
MTMPVKRINAWSSPRNISTALMYSFAQRKDTRVYDEPLYAHYLHHTPSEAEHPGAAEVLESQPIDAVQVVRETILGPCARPVAFFKQMTHHLIELDTAFLRQTDNILLIRDPRAIIASYSKVIPNPTLADIGVAQQLSLYEELQAAGTLRAVVDARQLLLGPRAVLSQLCEALGLPFDEAMLGWPPGARPEDGVWAKYWYASVHRSTGFMPYEEKPYVLSPAQEALAKECMPYYEVLSRVALTP